MSKALPRALAVCIALAAAGAAAETAYVTDILRLGLHEASDTSDRPFANLVSGTPLEVLERAGNYARVRTGDGREGWVKSAFIVTEKPARSRLAELEAERDALRERLAQARAARDDAKAELTRLDAALAAARDEAASAGKELARLRRENAAYAARLERDGLSLPLSWVAGALAVALIGGALGGWWTLDARIRRRYGGYRVW